MYWKDGKEQAEPNRIFPIHARIVSFGKTDKYMVFQLHKPEKKTEEFLLLPKQLLKNLKTFHAMGRKFGAIPGPIQDGADVEDEFEVVKTGSLAVKLEARDTAKERPKKRYCVLRSNGILYLFKSSRVRRVGYFIISRQPLAINSNRTLPLWRP